MVAVVDKSKTHTRNYITVTVFAKWQVVNYVNINTTQLLCAFLAGSGVGCLSLIENAIAVHFVGTGNLCIPNIVNHCRHAS